MSYITLYSRAFARLDEVQSVIAVLQQALPAIDGPFQIKTPVETGIDPESLMPVYESRGGDEWYFNAQALDTPVNADWIGPVPATPYRVFAA